MVAAAVRKMWEPSVGEDDEESRQGEVTPRRGTTTNKSQTFRNSTFDVNI